MKSILTACAFSFGIASIAQSPAQLPDSASSCSAKQEPGYMVSWSGQASAKDHAEMRALSKGTHLACVAFAADGAKAGCSVSMENNGHYTLSSHEAIRIPREDFVTLTCRGKNPTCCKVQMTPDPAPLKKGDTKPQAEPQLGIVGEQEDTSPGGSGQGI